MGVRGRERKKEARREGEMGKGIYIDKNKQKLGDEAHREK